MQLVEVLEGRGHLRHHRPCVGQVHAAHVVALERVHEALGHAIALRTAHRRVDRLQTQLPRNLPGLGGDVCAPVVGDCYDREILATGHGRAKGCRASRCARCLSRPWRSASVVLRVSLVPTSWSYSFVMVAVTVCTESHLGFGEQWNSEVR